ncbi:MAG: cobalamin B12-binding domain-containing protein [Pseudomonadota bacterium]
MAAARKPGMPFDYDAYGRARAAFEKLPERLPEDTVRSVAREVVQRLAERHRSEVLSSEPVDAVLTRLAHALVDHTSDGGLSIVETLRDEGLQVREIYLCYLAGAAAKLGAWWVDDRLSFIDVSIGSARIFGLLHALRPYLGVVSRGEAQSILLASVPGDMHTLGVAMAGDLLRDDGWDTRVLLSPTLDEILEAVEAHPVRIVGLSLGSDMPLTEFLRTATAVRVVAPGAAIVVGGAGAARVREIAELASVDAIVSDLDEAKPVLRSLALEGEAGRAV